MKSHLLTWLVFVLLLFSGISHAEGNCPEGYYPIGGGGSQGCAPAPSYNRQQGQQQSQKEAPSPRWVDRWGAIATDSAKKLLGTASDMNSRSEAENKAITDCQNKGGTQCKLQNSYGNACVAMISGDNIFNVGSAENMDRAVQLGIAQCSASDTNCRVFYSACSMPERTQ